MAVQEPRVRRWSRDEYHEMGRLGWFEGQRVELIDGEIIEMSPHGLGHTIVIGLVQQWLQQVFGAGYWIRCQLPLLIGATSEPEPEFAVVRGAPRDFKEHPREALLVIEVSETSIGYDLGEKASLYASAQLQDYWVVDLSEKRIHIHREPRRDQTALFGWRYDDVQSFEPDDFVSPLAAPAHRVKVADLHP